MFTYVKFRHFISNAAVDISYKAIISSKHLNRRATLEEEVSDFSAARVHLERAYDYLRGNDQTSGSAREALDLLIEAVAIAECRRPKVQVLPYPFDRTSRKPL